MNRIKPIMLLFLSFMIVLVACDRKRNISNEETKEYKKEVLAVEHVKKVAVNLWPSGNVDIDVYVTKDIDQKEINQVLELTKNYVTVSNMRKIKEQFKLGTEVDEIYLEFRNENGKLIKRYVAQYFKTYRRDDSPENVEAYKIWRDETPKLD